MPRVLFVTNGHGEAAIAGAIAREVADRTVAPLDHLPLVGSGFDLPALCEVGPRRALPSGGLVAMLNLPNLVRDVRAGLVRLIYEQWRFLRAAHATHALVVAVGDAYALAMALAVRRPVVFIGTAKSDFVATHNSFERRLMRAAARVFVRDARTARALVARGVQAEAPGNVIVDLDAGAPAFEWAGAERLVLLPGSREPAYGDARLLAAVVAQAATTRPELCAALSIAPSLDVGRMRAALGGEGWAFEPAAAPVAFIASQGGRRLIWAWTGPVRSLYDGATLAVGQAGTANEAAAAAGLPIVALDTPASKGSDWYRMRQGRLLGDALALVPGDPPAAAAALGDLLDDPGRRARMGAVGRERMGPPGGAAAIADAIAALGPA